MKITILWDPSASGAPAGFQQAVAAACDYVDSLIQDDITVSIQFGWGTAGPASDPTTLNLTSSTTAAGISLPPDVEIYQPSQSTLGTLVNELAQRFAQTGVADAVNIQSVFARNSYFASFNWFAIGYAQALALGFSYPPSALTENGVGYVAVNSTLPYNFDPAAPADPLKVDLQDILVHEITHVLGRASGFGSGSNAVVSELDLFRFSAANTPQITPGGGFFSLNGASMFLQYYPVSEDAADWLNQADTFGYGSYGNAAVQLAQVDRVEMAALGFKVAGLLPTIASITPASGAQGVRLGAGLTLGFSEAVSPGAGAIEIRSAADGSLYETISASDAAHVAASGASVTVALAQPLQPGAQYFVTVEHAFADDAFGLGVAAIQDRSLLVFTTATAAQEVGAWFPAVLREQTTGPHAAQASQLIADFTAGTLTTAGALKSLLTEAAATSSVATLAYQFFTGSAPRAAGMDFLVSPTGPNANNLNSAYYQSFNIENRYINFAVNLGKLGAGATAFNATYGSLSLFDATKLAYGTIFGITPSDTKVHALLDPTVTLGGATMTRADYFAYYGGDGASGIGTKAAMVGWLLAEAVLADKGTYALSNDAFLTDVALHGASFGVDVIGHYSQPGFAFNGG